MDSRPEEDKPLPSQSKTAILVIHGIGQQNPYETLDQFARGLADHLGRRKQQKPEIQPLLINHEGWNEVAIRLDLQGKATAQGSSLLDIYEFYWAPHTEGKITYLQVLRWLRRTALTPVRYLGYGYALFSLSGRRLAGAFVREIFRALFIFIPFVLLSFVLVYMLAEAELLFQQARSLINLVREPEGLDQALLFVLLGLFILTLGILRGLRVLHKDQKVVRTPDLRRRLVRWTYFAYCSFVLTAAITGGLAYYLRSYLVRGGREISPYLLPILAVGLAVWLKKILVGYVGDIAVYVTADAKAASFQARSAILREARESILRILRSPEDYQRVVLAGHSLGSVIAYDLLNRLLDEARAPYSTGPQGKLAGMLHATELARIQGLVTFGSPLDKIYYFFRTEVPAQQAIRAQILSFLHGFRRAPSNRDYDGYQFPQYTIPEPSPNFKWINIWSPADPVSGHLDFYHVVGREKPNSASNQLPLEYPWRLWGRAHIKYWDDRKFYDYVAQQLL